MSNKIILKGRVELLKPIITEILALHQILEEKDIGTIYGEPAFDYQTRRKFKPQIELFFKEDEADVVDDYQPVKGRISFRIMNETSNTISKAELTALGRKIKDVFGANNGYVWRKGKELYSYTDVDKGYGLQILARSEANAIEVATKILSIQGHSFIKKNMQLCKNLDELNEYPYEPPKQLVLGDAIKAPRYRPNVEVRFHYATAHIHGLPKAVLLYSRTRNKSKALVT